MIGLYGILATSFCADTKVEFSPQKSIAKANFARKAPVIDGKISKNEYTGSFENFGLLKHNNNFLASRQGRVFTALDSKYLYFAMQTEMPDADSNVKLKARYKRRDSKIFVDDSVEFLFVSPVALLSRLGVKIPLPKPFAVDGGNSPQPAAHDSQHR